MRDSCGRRRLLKIRKSSSLFHCNSFFDVRPDGERRDGSKAGPNPVHHKVLHRGVAPATELEGGCEDWVEVTPAGREGSAHHRGRDEAVDGSRILRFFESNETRSKTTDEGGDSLNDCTVQHRHSQVSRAHIVDCRVGAPDVCLCNFKRPKHLDHPENGNSSKGLSHSTHCSLLPAHISLDALLEMVVRASSCISPFHGPPDGEEEEVETISRQSIVVSNDDQFKAAATEIGSSNCFVESRLDEARVQRSNHLPGEFTEEEDEKDVAGGDGDAGDQRHPGAGAAPSD